MQNLSLRIPTLALGTALCGLLFVVLPQIAVAQTTPAQGVLCGTQRCAVGQTCTRIPSPDGVAAGNQFICEGAATLPNGNTQETTSVSNPVTTTTGVLTTDQKGNVVSNTLTSKSTLGIDVGSCNLGSVITGSIGDCILDAVASFILGITNFILGICGVLLNWVIVKTVFQFSTLVGNSNGLLTAWHVLRDLGNLLLLFGFVFIGINIILDSGKYADKKAIPSLIIFAILINFSIFAAEAVIDTSNVLTSVMYTQANTDPCVTTQCNINDGIAGRIMESTGLSSIYALKPADYASFGGTKKLLLIFGLSIFGVVGIIVLLSTAIMLAIRAIVLTGLIIVSPIGFAGMALPPLNGMAKKWWGMLINQSFFAPVLFLLIFIALKVTEGFTSVGNNTGLASALANSTDNMGIIMVFVLVSGAMLASLVAAKSFGAIGADNAIKFAGNFAGRTTFGSGAVLGRNTAGYAFTRINQQLDKTKWAQNTRFGRQLKAFTTAGANNSYDLRATKPFANATNALGGAVGVKLDLGKPQGAAAKGFAGIEKENIDKRVKYGQSLKMSEAATERKKVLDAQVKSEGDKNKKDQESFKNQENKLNADRKSTETAWQQRAQQIDKDITDIQNKAAANAGNRAVDDLNRQIAAENLNTQRLMAQGTVAEVTASKQRVQDLEKQRDDFVNASQKLTELQNNRAKELKEYEEKIKKIDTDIANVKAAQTKNAENYNNTIKGITEELDSLNPQRQYANTLRRNEFTGGRANIEAAKKIEAELKKSKGEKDLEKIKAALEKSGMSAEEAASTTESLKTDTENA